MKKYFLIFAIILIAVTIGASIYFSKGRSKPRSDITNIPYTEESLGQLEVKSQPELINVTIGSLENSFLETKQTPFKIQLPSGKYLITGFKTNYKNYEKIIEIKKGQESTLEIKLDFVGEDIEEGAP